MTRGYNQSALLASSISRSLHIEFKPHALSRVKETLSQVGLNSKERQDNVFDAFKADSIENRNKSVLVIDDIATTGSTLNECAKALKECRGKRSFLLHCCKDTATQNTIRRNGGQMNKKVDIFTKEMELNEEIRDFIDKKISRLYRYLDQIDETRIDLAHAKTAKEEANRFVAQITLRGRGFILRAEERADNIKAALDLVIDKIERQIERYKGKKYRSRAGATPASELLTEEDSRRTIAGYCSQKKVRSRPYG